MSTVEFVTIACTVAGAVAGALVRSLLDHLLTHHDRMTRLREPLAGIVYIDIKQIEAERDEAREESARLRSRIADLERKVKDVDDTARPDAA